jgi:thioredoxin 1
MLSTIREEPHETTIAVIPIPFPEEMHMKKLLIHLALLMVFNCLSLAGETLAASEVTLDIPVKDTVTMVDLGAKTCIPCKMMAPILEEMKGEYQGRAEVIFLDVWEDPSQGKRFGIMSIPTQIFFDKHGKEVYRHTGFMDKEKIKKWLDMLLERE